MARDPGSRRRLNPSKRRQQLLDVGLDLLDRTGDQPSTREVAERAGVTPGLLYRYFPDQQALRETLLEEAAMRLSQATRWPDRTFADALPASLQAEIEFAARHEGLWHALHSAPIVIRRRLQDERVGRLLGHRAVPRTPHARILAGGWVGFCQGSIEAWLDRRDLAPDELATLLASTLEPTLTTLRGDAPVRPRTRKPRVRLLGTARPSAQ
jgi:AcrR family transcriptional regulator